jgi:hypothetical protein
MAQHNGVHKDDNKCECAVCAAVASGKTGEEALAANAAWEAEQMAKHGWYVHIVMDEDDESPTGFNVHTHGLMETYRQLDFQVVAVLHPEVIHALLIVLAKRIKDGLRVKDGDILTAILAGGFKLKAVAAREGGRDVLRLIVPGKDGEVDRDKMSGRWVEQYGDL